MKKLEERIWYFTFKGDDRYVKIHGTFEGARLEMFRRYGREWLMQHGSAESAGVEALKEIPYDQASS